MNPSTPKPPPPLEQILELLSEHVASNDRVTTAIERFREQFPLEAERILAEHRRLIPAPTQHTNPPMEPATAETKPILRNIVDLSNIWGSVIVGLILLSSGAILYFVAFR